MTKVDPLNKVEKKKKKGKNQQDTIDARETK